MKNLFYASERRSVRAMSSLIICTFFLLQPLNSQSLFDIAMKLDSLAELIEKDSNHLAQPFFDEFAKIYDNNYYQASNDYSPGFIRNDVADNVLLSPIVSLAFTELSYSNPDGNNLFIKLKAQKDSIGAILFDSIRVNCKTPNCSELPNFEEYAYYARNYNEYYVQFFADAVIQLDDNTKKSLQPLMREMTRLNYQLEQSINKKSSKVQQSQNVGVSLPPSSDFSSTAVIPITIQQAGGGSAQSAIIDGAAKWMAQRMRQELSIAFFDRFEDWADEKNISLLFPNTLSVLKASATTDYTLMMQVYRKAFEKDLDVLTFNLPVFLEKELQQDSITDQTFQRLVYSQFQIDSISSVRNKIYSEMGLIYDLMFQKGYQEFSITPDSLLSDSEKKEKRNLNNRYYELLRIDSILNSSNAYYVFDSIRYNAENLYNKTHLLQFIKLSLEAINQFKEGNHPSAMLTHLSNNSGTLAYRNPKLEGVLLLLNLLSQSLITTDSSGNTVWAGKERLKKIRTDAQFRVIYIGLIYQKAKQILWSRKQNIDYKIYEYQYNYYNAPASSNYKYFFDNYAAPFILDGIQAGKDSIDIWNDILEEYKTTKPEWDNVDTLSIKEKYGLFLSLIQTAYYKKYYASPRDFIYDTLSNEYMDNVDSTLLILEKLIEVKPVYEGFSTINNIKYYLLESNVFLWLNAQYEYTPDTIYHKLERLDLNNNYYANLYIRDYAKSLLINPSDSTYLDSLLVDRIKEKISLLKKQAKKNIILEEVFNSVNQGNFAYFLQTDSIQSALAFKSQYPQLLKLEKDLNFLNQQKDFLRGMTYGNIDGKNFGDILNRFLQFTGKVKSLNDQIKNLKENEKANFGNPEFIFLIKNSMELVDIIFELAIQDPENIKMVNYTKDKLLDAFTSALDKDYHGLVMNLVPVVQNLVEHKYNKKIAPIEDALRAQQPAKDRELGLLPHSPELDSLRTLRDDKLRKMQEVFKYATFIAAVAESKNADDVKKAIQAIALPVGSYSIKRRTYSNISLNAYPGITGGAELIQNSSFSEWAPNFGFTAQIGIGYNWGYRNKINLNKYRNKRSYRERVQKEEMGSDEKFFNGHSGSIFIPLIDLGALVLFRLNDSDEPLPQDVSLKQIFSPGLMYVHGLPKVPISIMGGFQMTPQLRTVGEDLKANSFRFNLSLVVDLPIANFHTRRREKIKD